MYEVLEWLGVCEALEWLGVYEILGWSAVCEVWRRAQESSVKLRGTWERSGELKSSRELSSEELRWALEEFLRAHRELRVQESGKEHGRAQESLTGLGRAHKSSEGPRRARKSSEELGRVQKSSV